MAETPNPYKPPDAPVDLHADAPALHGVRVMLRVLVVAQLALIVVAILLPDTLQPDLKQLRDDIQTAFFNKHGVLALASLAVLVASLFGLWWEKRWAGWAYLGTTVVDYSLQLVAGPSISADLVELLDSFADAAIGATLVTLYLGGFFTSPRESQNPPPAA